MKSQRRWRSKSLVLGLSALIILPLSAEIACRIQRQLQDRVAKRFLKAHPTLYDQTRSAMEAFGDSLWLDKFWTYRPGARLTMNVGGVQYDVAINRLGYRDREFTVEKPPGVIRVVCIGGSTTVQGVRNEETYPALLEHRLRARFGTNVQVVNLGVSGHHSGHWAGESDLAQVLRLKPDVVVQYEGVNDICGVHVPIYEKRHPVWALLRKSLLLNRRLPIEPREMNLIAADSLANMETVRQALRTNGARYVVGTFARPNVARATPEQRAYYDFNTAQFGGWHNSSLRNYAEYAALLDHFNAQLVDRAQQSDWTLAPVHERISNPMRFVDICHMTPQGVAELAAAFEPEVAAVIEPLLHRLRPQSGN